MYIRVTPLRFDPAREDDIIQLTTEQLIPALRQAPGFRHYFGTADRGTPGRGFVITVWEMAQQAEGLRTVFSGLIGQFQALGLELETSQVQEVIAHA